MSESDIMGDKKLKKDRQRRSRHRKSLCWGARDVLLWQGRRSTRFANLQLQHHLTVRVSSSATHAAPVGMWDPPVTSDHWSSQV